jgi:D-alanyl-D-alanine carboxypeptidase (penicillin-binding protein 5/6)
VLKTGESIKKMKHDVQLKEKVAAPTKKGDVVGKIVVTHKGKVVSTSPVVLKENVKEASLLQLWQRTMGYMTLSNQ